MERQLDMPDIPNEEFPDGVMFGYYYNYCENEEWKDTGKRSEKLVCCLVCTMHCVEITVS